MTTSCARSEITVAGAVCIGPWGDDVQPLYEWVATGVDNKGTLRKPSGFIESRFSPLIYTAVSRCLETYGSEIDLARTGVALSTILGDTTTADVASRNLHAGRVHNPLLFYQSVPTSILGHVGREWGIRGPLVCVSAGGDAAECVAEIAELLLDAGDVDAMLALYVELGLDIRSRRVHDLLASLNLRELACEDDMVVCLLLRRSGDDWSTDSHHGLIATSQGVRMSRLGTAAQSFVEWAARTSRSSRVIGSST